MFLLQLQAHVASVLQGIFRAAPEYHAATQHAGPDLHGRESSSSPPLVPFAQLPERPEANRG